MKFRRIAIITGFIISSASMPLHAADLMRAYYKALASDPTFKKANSDWESAKENLPISRAAYLTQMSITGNAQRQYNNIDPPLAFPINNGYNFAYGMSLSVTQPLFNLPAWDAIQRAHATVKAATATYSSAGQNLMLRTVKAYVGVLQAYDQLRFQLAQKRAVKEQLKVAEQQFHVGLIAITGVYNARSSYDQAAAQAIADQNTLNDRVEELAEITGEHYVQVNGIGKRVPLVKPRPADINAWTDLAAQQNYQLQADNFSVIAAREKIKQESTKWAPQLNLAGSYTFNRQSQYGDGIFDPGGVLVPGGDGGIPAINQSNVLYGFSLNFPFLQGGLVHASTKQAEYDFLSASNQRELTYRTVMSDTRQSYLGVITGISKIQADWQSIVSARNSLNATKAGYEVGTRTMVDVLDDVSTLYQTEKSYTDDQYSYIIDLVELKFNAGTLSVNDLQIINRWLQRNIRLNLSKEALKAIRMPLSPIKPFPAVENASLPPKNRRTVADISVASPIAYAAPKKPTLSLPAPKATEKQEPVRSVALPMPKATQSVAPRKRVSMNKTSIVKRVPTVQRTPTAKTMSSVKKIPRHQVASLDQEVLPLYDTPPTDKDALPPPS